MSAAQVNSAWQARVHGLMRQGLGYEDIAVLIGCDVASVRREASILQQEGRLTAMYRWQS